ncbi:hypothetical protein D9M70_490990 [compost metagenome]
MAAQDVQRGLGALADVFVEVGPELGGQAQAQLAEYDRRQRALAGDQRVEQRHVGHAQGHRAHGVAAAGDRNHPAVAVAPLARTQRGAAVERRRDAHRAAGVGAQRRQGHARAQRRGTAGGRAAGDARAVVGVAHADFAAGVERAVVAGGAEGQLVHVGLAEDDRPRLAQRAHGGCVRLRNEVGEGRRAGGAGQPGAVDIVLDHHRDTAQRQQRLARPARGVGGAGGGQRALPVQGDEHVQRAAFLGPLQAGAHQLDAAQHAIAERGLGLGYGQVAEHLGVDRFEHSHCATPRCGLGG